MKKVTYLICSIYCIVLISCSQSGQKSEKAEPAEKVETAPTEVEKPSVFFKHPKDGATVPSPVYIEMGVKGMQIEPAGEVKEGFGHHHILINQKSWPKGEIIPTSDTTIHFGKGQTDASIELEAGEYEISLQFADGVHASYGEEMAASINIKVE